MRQHLVTHNSERIRSAAAARSPAPCCSHSISLQWGVGERPDDQRAKLPLKPTNRLTVRVSLQLLPSSAHGTPGIIQSEGTR